MRWLLVLLVFAAGIGIGMYLSQPRPNEVDEAEVSVLGASRPQPVEKTDPLAERDFVRLVELAAGEFLPT